jgi:hypothetical protein
VIDAGQHPLAQVAALAAAHVEDLDRRSIGHSLRDGGVPRVAIDEDALDPVVEVPQPDDGRLVALLDARILPLVICAAAVRGRDVERHGASDAQCSATSLASPIISCAGRFLAWPAAAPLTKAVEPALAMAVSAKDEAWPGSAGGCGGPDRSGF